MKHVVQVGYDAFVSFDHVPNMHFKSVRNKMKLMRLIRKVDAVF